MDSLLEESWVSGARAGADIQTGERLAGTDICPCEDVGTITVKSIHSLLLAANHLNEGLRRLAADPKTRSHPNVQSALERGLRGCRSWNIDAPRQVLAHIIDRANKYHKGAMNSFIQVCKKYIKEYSPCWITWKSDNLKENENLPPSGPGSEYNMMWDVISKAYKKLPISGKEELHNLKAVVSDMEKWGVTDEFFRTASKNCDFISPTLSTSQVIKSMLCVCSAMKEFHHTLPLKEFQDLFITCSLFAYPNRKKRNTAGDEFIEVQHLKDAMDCDFFKAIMKSGMSTSALYDPKKQKQVTKAKGEKETGENKENDGGEGENDFAPGGKTVKRRRGKAADKNAEESKKRNVMPTEHMVLQIIGQHGKVRDRQWPEDLVSALRAALANCAEEKWDRRLKREALLACIAWARNGGHLEWRGMAFTKAWIPTRKSVKSWLAKSHNSKAMEEDGDEVEEINKAAGGERNGDVQSQALPKWERYLSDADVKAQILRFTSEPDNMSERDDEFQRCGAYSGIVSLLSSSSSKGAGNKVDMLQFLSDAYDRFEAVINQELREGLCGATKYMGRSHGALPLCCIDLIDPSHIKALLEHRSRCMLLLFKNFASTFDQQAMECVVSGHADDLCKLDAGVMEAELWNRVWSFVVAPLEEDESASVEQQFGLRMDTIRSMLLPLAPRFFTRPLQPLPGDSQHREDSQHNDKEKADKQDKEKDTKVISLASWFDQYSLQVKVKQAQKVIKKESVPKKKTGANGKGKANCKIHPLFKVAEVATEVTEDASHEEPDSVEQDKGNKDVECLDQDEVGEVEAQGPMNPVEESK